MPNLEGFGNTEEFNMSSSNLLFMAPLPLLYISQLLIFSVIWHKSCYNSSVNLGQSHQMSWAHLDVFQKKAEIACPLALEYTVHVFSKNKLR